MTDQDFLFHDTPAENNDAIERKTKKIILQIAGDYDSAPESLQDGIDLKIHLLYGDDEYSLLQIRLQQLVSEYNQLAELSNGDVEDCDTVGDCIELVKSKAL